MALTIENLYFDYCKKFSKLTFARVYIIKINNFFGAIGTYIKEHQRELIGFIPARVLCSGILCSDMATLSVQDL